MNILLIGSGGREHAFAYKLAQSPLCTGLFIAPGNAGTAAHGTNVPLNPLDFNAVEAFCLSNNIGMVVVGPEEPLVKGMRDHFEANGQLKHIPFVGPGKDGAVMEGSKDWSKAFMAKYRIPTAAYRTFTADTIMDGIDYVKQHSLPVVLKADGLAAGKGVLICGSNEEAALELEAMIRDQKFGNASAKVVVEQFLEGIELSVFVLCDGKNYTVLPSAKDYKRIGEGDTGLNTGGMGAISPVPFANQAFMQKVEDRIIKPTVNGLLAEGIDYKGFIFIGLMNMDGEPFVIEYNSRMGDPETEAVLPRITSDFGELMLACATGKLNEYNLTVSEQTAVTVMLVSEGYPGDYAKGKVMTGLENIKGSFLFHAGTKRDEAGNLLTNGGRVLAITSNGNNIGEALAISMRNAQQVSYEGKYYRKDIGYEFI